MDPVLPPTTGDYRGDPAIALNLTGCLVPIALASESGNKPWSQGRARSGKGIHERVVRVFTSEGVDLFVVRRNGNEKLLEKTCPGNDSGTTRRDDSVISGCRNSLANLFKTFRNAFGISAVMVNEKSLDRSWTGPLQFVQTGPAFQEFGRDVGVDLIEPVEHRGKYIFRWRGKAIRVVSLFMNEFSPLLHQKLQGPRFRGVRVQPAELIAMER